MSVQYYIEDVALPQSQNFNALKEEALNYLQKNAGNEWTNFNPSDPGVTILDQVCLALTELGYCIDFPIKDILTKKDETLRFKDQFFKPSAILTTAPISSNDFKKALLGNIKGISNVVINPLPSQILPISGVYQVWLAQDVNYTLDTQVLCKAAQLFLNGVRNVGELFFLPEVLSSKKYLVHGTLYVATIQQLKITLEEINDAIRETIFSTVKPRGYDQLTEEGFGINEIYNGPKLKNGWIVDNELTDKNDQISIAEVTTIARSQESISAVNLTSFLEEKRTSTTKLEIGKDATKKQVKIKVKPKELIVIDFIQSVLQKKLTINVSGKEYKKGDDFEAIKRALETSASAQKANKTIKSSLTSKPSVPKGKFRDIEDYYSIQNTFPEVYAVGLNAVNKNSSAHAIGLSRQLKGYLSLFDQVLSNQFSQLENMHKLLSFKNSLTADTADEQLFYEQKNTFEKEHLIYPAPYLKFSPSYFYQSIYEAPNIRALLKNFDAFDSFEEGKTEKEQEHESWEAYKDSPYNAYVHGLMNFIEKSSTAYERRNEFLDHLLARHGQSPELIDSIIEGSPYTINPLMNKIIVKSLYLQNFDLLNYHEQAAYRFQSASTVKSIREVLQQIKVKDWGNSLLLKEIKNLRKELAILEKEGKRTKKEKELRHQLLLKEEELGEKKFKRIIQEWKEGWNKDFVFRAHQVDHLEKIKKSDGHNFYGLALKFNLLLSVRAVYQRYIINQYEEHCNKKSEIEGGLIDKEMKQAYWLMEQKGALFLEPNLLLQTATFTVFLGVDVPHSSQKVYYQFNETVNYQEFVLLEQCLKNTQKVSLTSTFLIGKKKLTLKKINDDKASNNFIQLANSKIAVAYKAGWENVTITNGNTIAQNTMLVVVPNFVEDLSEASFQNRLNTLITSSLPPSFSYVVLTANSKQLGQLISAYRVWHNSLLVNLEAKKQTEILTATTKSKEVIDVLKELKVLTTQTPQEHA